MKLIEQLCKATLEVKRALELPFLIEQSSRVLDDEIRAFDNLTKDAELELIRLRTAFAEAEASAKRPNGEKYSPKAEIFRQIVQKKLEIEDARAVAEIAKNEKELLWSEVQ